MNKCQLCLANDAVQIGSHIIPHFLFIRVVSVDGSTARGKEFAFTIGEYESKTEFGQAVLPEQMESSLERYQKMILKQWGRLLLLSITFSVSIVKKD